MKRFILLLIILSTGLSVSAGNHPEWLRKAVFYQIYPSSFQDNDGNGIGDIKGVQTRLDYIQSVGVNTIWFNPLFKSAFQDGGYDVIDYYQVDPRFGTNT
jgi:maltose alpha-D-glucosyltransferase/alpha-amylase